MTETRCQTIRDDAMQLLRKLDPLLTYHSIQHTLDVVKQALRIAEAEGITDEHDLMLLEAASFFHDLGFLYTYKNHEEKSCEIFEDHAAGYDLSSKDIERVRAMIMATKLPQEPATPLQRIICDADLDYLGRPDFFSISLLLKEEFIQFHIVINEFEWEQLQLKFLSNHYYHTASQQELREPFLKQHLHTIRQQNELS